MQLFCNTGTFYIAVFVIGNLLAIQKTTFEVGLGVSEFGGCRYFK